MHAGPAASVAGSFFPNGGFAAGSASLPRAAKIRLPEEADKINLVQIAAKKNCALRYAAHMQIAPFPFLAWGIKLAGSEVGQQGSRQNGGEPGSAPER
jgi:hypothetical protein